MRLSQKGSGASVDQEIEDSGLAELWCHYGTEIGPVFEVFGSVRETARRRSSEGRGGSRPGAEVSRREHRRLHLLDLSRADGPERAYIGQNRRPTSAR